MDVETESPDEKEDPLTLQQVISYLDAHKVKQHCSGCDNKLWDVLTLGDGFSPGFVVQAVGPPRRTVGAVPLTILECVQCGNLLLFREQRVRDFLEGTGKTSDDGGADNV